MTGVEETFGENAGKVWYLLKEKGPLSSTAIARKTDLKRTEVFGALGWLAREGKIEMEEAKRGTYYSLKE